MKRASSQLLLPILMCGLCFSVQARAADWPTWRYDAARSAESPERLPEALLPRWVREFPPLQPAYREARLQFDAGYEPVVLGKTLFVASSRTDGVVALDTETGEARWAFYTEGPVRFAPAAWRDRVFFGSDDGHLYCVDAERGELLWKFRAVPSQRKVLGNGRMISLWPVRGGVVVQDGKVYFAAGVWPLEGVFIYSLDALSGDVVWRNEECSFRYGTQPHAAEALGGVTPQGYLVIAGDELIVPCGQALPARLDLKSGKLKSFELPKPGRLPGGWFASAAARRGQVVLDATINRDLHEDKIYQGPGSPGVRSRVTIGEKTYQFSDKWPGVTAAVHTLLAADGKLFIVDQDGQLYCFGGQKTGHVPRHELPTRHAPTPGSRPVAEDLEWILKTTNAREGYAWIRGDQLSFPALRDLTNALRHQTKFHLVVTDSNAASLDQMRRHEGVHRDRLCLLKGEGENLRLPAYFASLIISTKQTPPTIEELNCLRPYGGVAGFPLSEADHNDLKSRIENSNPDGFTITRTNNLTLIRRGELPGAANYQGGWSSPDERVRAPLGVLWFDDALGHFKRSPQPWFVDGVMVSYPKDWMEKHRANQKLPYRLLPPVFSDVYTGRIIAADEPLIAGLEFPRRDLNEVQPNQYRPPTQQDAWKPKQPILGERVNPLTGETEPRAIPKSYGCDGGVDYGFFYTMRSGTPAFYDKRLESGTCNVAGPRSGCTNSIIPACGVLNVPYFYEGCTCSYPLPVGLAMISRPPEHEQWSSWGLGPAKGIRRVGINFGAPGDRMTPAGTLWLDAPNRGGPSPPVAVSVEPESTEFFYHHSLFMEGGSGWPWVAASGVKGARTIKINGLKPGTVTVRLYFSDPEFEEPNQRLFDVAFNNVPMAKTVDVAQLAGGRLRGLMQEHQNVKVAEELRITLHPHQGETILSGVEIVSAGDRLDVFSRK